MRKTTKKIIDEFTDLPVSRQRKWQLRHLEVWKKYRREYAKKKRGYKKRYLRVKSYKEKERNENNKN